MSKSINKTFFSILVRTYKLDLKTHAKKLVKTIFPVLFLQGL